LTRGKYAPTLKGVAHRDIYEAMQTGPQSMPVFNDQNITPENKRNIIAWINEVQNQSNQGGNNLGNLGPVSEGMFIWIFGLGIMVAIAVWLGSKAA
jgi:ubiquinol-cytochrome c reductase cytochrome c subunit